MVYKMEHGQIEYNGSMEQRGMLWQLPYMNFLQKKLKTNNTTSIY